MVASEQKQGKVRLIRSAQACPNCGGSGVIPGHRTLEVSIPPGVAEGTRIRLKGQGGKGPRADLNGDLFLTVHLEPHPVFAVSGRDLRVSLPVWDYEAALGAEVTAPLLGGGKVSLNDSAPTVRPERRCASKAAEFPGAAPSRRAIFCMSSRCSRRPVSPRKSAG